MTNPILAFHNGEPVALADVPCVPLNEFRTRIITAVHEGCWLIALFGTSVGGGRLQLISVLGDRRTSSLTAMSAGVDKSYPCLTVECPQAHRFEREIAEQWKVEPLGHPWLKPIRFHALDRSCTASQTPLPAATEFFTVRGDEVHEVAVGPVHAGIIEPGHFRFQCHGERVLNLEVALGYQHRGIEAALIGGPGKRTIHEIETLAGDTSIGHATVYCEMIEGLSGVAAPARAQVLRGIMLELERLANHTGDLGALAGDVGFLPTAAYCGRIRGDFLNLTAAICGSRFGRGMIRPGGVLFDVDGTLAAELIRRLGVALRDVENVIQLMWNTPTVQARFQDTGTLTVQTCESLGLVGPVARASGLECDIRQDFPSGLFRFAQIPPARWDTGDVFARAWVRWLEIQRSGVFLREQLAALPVGPIFRAIRPLRPAHLVVSLSEGWRGAICHASLTDSGGRFARYKVVDPSFRNWSGLEIAMRDQQISDFPLCNKSFNLSYCGHDL